MQSHRAASYDQCANTRQCLPITNSKLGAAYYVASVEIDFDHAKQLEQHNKKRNCFGEILQ